jgi:4-amino-4-deoxy-L-arabinose transferase-like glycosyltransferase
VSHMNHYVAESELAAPPQIQSAKVEVRAKDTRSLRPVLLLVAVAGLLLLVRLSPVMRRPGITWAITSDAIGYVRLAEGLATGCGFAPRFGDSCGPAEVFRTPGYPLFLAALPNLRTALVIQDALGAGVCLLVGLFAWRQWGLIAGLLAELLCGFDIPSIFWGNYVMTDILFTSLITPAFLLQLTAIKRGTLEGWTLAAIVGAGVLVAVAALVRPIGQLLIVEVLIPVFLLHEISLRKRLALILMSLCLPGIVVVAWRCRNYERRGVWTFSSEGAFVLYAGTAAGVLAYETARPFAEVLTDLVRSLPRIGDANAQDWSRKNLQNSWSETFDVRLIVTNRLTETGGFPRAFVYTPEDPEDTSWNNVLDADPAKVEQRAFQVLVDHPWAAAVVIGKQFLKNCFSVERDMLGSFLFGGGFNLEPRGSRFRFLLTPVAAIADELRLAYTYPGLAFLTFVDLSLLAFTWMGVGLALARIAHAPLRSVVFIVMPLCGALLLLATAAANCTPSDWDRFRVPAIPMLALVAAFGWTGVSARRWDDVREDEE